MALPPLAPFPPITFRKEILPEEWEQCLDSWIFLAEAHLCYSDDEFAQVADGDTQPLPAFLVSYFHEAARAAKGELYFQGTKSLELKRLCFRLTHRLLSRETGLSSLLQWDFLTNVSQTFPRNQDLAELMRDLWRRKGAQIESVLEPVKKSLTKTLDSTGPAAAGENLKRLAPFLHVSPDAGRFFMAGSDFLDALAAGYQTLSVPLRKDCVAVAYLGLLALTLGEKPNYSMMYDHLYGLRVNAEGVQKKDSSRASLLSDVVTNTPFLRRVGESAREKGNTRTSTLLQSLQTFRQPNIARPRKTTRRKPDKGKGKSSTDEFGHGVIDGALHGHRMSLVSQIQDLFPELGSGFIVKLLIEYHDDVEQTTAHYLDGSLPPHLQEADKSEQLPPSAAEAQDPIPFLAPSSTPPPTRRNIYDDDEFDRLEMDPSLVHQGRKNASGTADALLSTAPNSSSKAAILAALAAFDSDDDERDDTYDVDDVGGTVDTTAASTDDAGLDKNEEALFAAFQLSQDTFARDATTRRGKARAALRNETGLTDEAIEGWATMLRRDPRRLRRLEARFATFSGQQNEISRTSYRRTPAASGDEAEDSGKDSGSRGRERGRGRGGRGRGGGNVAGSANEKDTQVSRQRKEANKSSRANHNRRDQRARKMARGGFPG